MELSDCLALDSVTADCSTTVSEYEIQRAALTIAHAMVNPCEYMCQKDGLTAEYEPNHRLCEMGC